MRARGRRAVVPRLDVERARGVGEPVLTVVDLCKRDEELRRVGALLFGDVLPAPIRSRIDAAYSC